MSTAVDNVAGSAAAARALDGASKTSLGQDEFLRLMLAQLKNQDPLKPLEPTEFVTQLAQFSQVSGIKEMNDSLTALADSLAGSRVMDGAALVGRGVLAESDTLVLPEGGSAHGAVDVPAGASRVQLTIKDAAGQLVRSIELSPKAGATGYSWDGLTNAGEMAEPGEYTVEALATIGGDTESLPVYAAGYIDSVSMNRAAGTLTLNTSTLGSLDLADVREIF